MSPRIKSLAWIFLAMNFLIPRLVEAQRTAEPACKQRLLTLCSQTEDGSSICDIVRSNRPITPKGLSKFLAHIAGLVDDQAKEDLICARLMGIQDFSGFSVDTDINLDVVSFIYYDRPNGKAVLMVQYDDRDMLKIRENIEELHRIGMEKHSFKTAASAMSFKGFVREVKEGFWGGSFTIRIERAHVNSLFMPAERMRGTSSQWSTLASQRLKKAYAEIMDMR